MGGVASADLSARLAPTCEQINRKELIDWSVVLTVVRNETEEG
jgi:hypothetical protein